ncbi:nuclear transport factor 2 family protein [Enhygromyxa salina]|uniref:SnoaL-like domain protein n=1 Tax=Enhygromyxa salina TaxID=215803 RepID=A0A2S9YW29_9BACT|nr:nuclear transport factor 2 family protein [Enhygromyxa salina]PRQ09249.1 SnoaL-like domain protein [Enhygromyxa salina]
MPTPAETIEQFYTAFAKQDADAMVACYHPNVSFSDPVFVDLDAREACGMWRMLCERAQDFSLEFSNVSADGERGSAHWEARYVFTTTGRRVHNVIDATFRFADGKIIEHRDQFDFYSWSRQALGMPGLLLGWSGVIRNKVRGQARKGLESYLRKHPG